MQAPFAHTRMAFLDVAALLAPLSDDQPCGEDLEYDAGFGEMERAAAGRPEQQMGDSVVPAEEPDWRGVARMGKELFGRSRDLRVAVRLTQAGTRTAGIDGLRDGLALVQGLIELMWDHVHPQLDPDDGNDPTIRVNTLLGLVAPNESLRAIREMTLVTEKMLGPVRYIDVLGEAPTPAAGEDGPRGLDSAQIDAIFDNCDAAEFEAALEAITSAVEAAQGIDAALAAKVGSHQAPDLSALAKLLQEIAAALNERWQRRGGAPADVGAVAGGEAGAPAGGGAAAPAPPPGTIASRNDAMVAIDKICDYFRKNEPSSPVPVILTRAKRLITKDFMSILQDIAPDGVDQFQILRGGDAEEEA